MLTLNSHQAYKKLRELRVAAQNNHTPAAGAVLAGGLLS
jgi:uncharacterized FlgJ-related protein